MVSEAGRLAGARPANAAIGDAQSLVNGLGSGRIDRFAGRIYDDIFHAIVTGRLPRGAKLPSEIEIAEAFGVSRPVVREALDRLRAENLLESRRGSGSYVTAEFGEMAELSTRAAMARMNELLSGIELRLILEPEAARLAAARRAQGDLDAMETALDGYEAAVADGHIAHHFDYAFHEAIATSTGNNRIVLTLKSLEYDVSHAVNLMRHMSHFAPVERSVLIMQEHRAVLACIRGMDPEGAARAMRNHIEHARMRMLGSAPETRSA